MIKRHAALNPHNLPRHFPGQHSLLRHVVTGTPGCRQFPSAPKSARGPDDSLPNTGCPVGIRHVARVLYMAMRYDNDGDGAFLPLIIATSGREEGNTGVHTYMQ